MDLAVEAERAGVFDAVWVGDSLLAKPRLESVTLLSARAGIPSRVRLGVGCLATFVHRHPVLFAQQWASLDVLSRGRAWLVVCLGGPSDANAAQAAEHAGMGVRSSERVARPEGGVAILRPPFHQTNPSPPRRLYPFDGVPPPPRPVPSRLGSALYHNVNINGDRRTALAEAKAFLEAYYTTTFSPEFVEQWTVAGSPRQCVADLRAYFDAGVGHMALRLASWDQQGQLKRFLGEVAPAFGGR